VEIVNGNKYAPVPGKIPGVAINLGGREFILAPLSLIQVEALEEQINGLSNNEGLSLGGAVAKGLPIILAALQRNYPDITAEALKPLLDLANIAEATRIIINASGLTRTIPPGEPAPASP
jgi:hypothetical protein